MARSVSFLTSRLPLRAGTASLQGLRADQEDAHTERVSGDEPYDFVALFDGHGGSGAADWCAENIGRVLKDQLSGEVAARGQAEVAAAVRRALEELERQFVEVAQEKQLGDGTTVVLAVVYNSHLVIGNIGDSEAVLCRRDYSVVVGLTEIHNPGKNPEEEARVVARGGKIFGQRVCHPLLSPFVISISVSRSVGDTLFKLPEFCKDRPPALTAEPFVTARRLEAAEDWFVLLACDGVFDVMTKEEAARVAGRLLAENNNPVAAAEAVVREALSRGSSDNCTCQVLVFDF